MQVFYTMAGAQSGVAVAEECGAKFLELKRKNKFKYLTFRIEDGGKAIVFDKEGPPTVQNYEAGAPLQGRLRL